MKSDGRPWEPPIVLLDDESSRRRNEDTRNGLEKEWLQLLLYENNQNGPFTLEFPIKLLVGFPI